MGKGRLEAFSDGVLAIVITIMVLELKIPHDTSAEALKELLPVFTSYVLSFIYVAIYWNNHHHLLHTVKQVNGRNTLGGSALAILAFADAVRDRLDRRIRLSHLSNGFLRLRAPDGWRRIPRSSSSHHRCAGKGFNPCARDRRRHQVVSREGGA